MAANTTTMAATTRVTRSARKAGRCPSWADDLSDAHDAGTTSQDGPVLQAEPQTGGALGHQKIQKWREILEQKVLACVELNICFLRKKEFYL